MAYAFVTLVTSDAYLPGALVVASALRDLHPSPAQLPEVDFQTVCLVTPETVDVKTIKLLRRAFDLVVGVEVIAVDQSVGLNLLGRPDLHTVLTKLHMLRLTQFDKVIFLDADVLPLRPLSHLFSLPHEFAAVPDVGWPDIFNSGVMVFAPGEDKFNQVMALVHSKGSWDGGDQGVLNEWRGDNWHRLSFKYNTTPTAAYTYAPAYERFGSSISAIHFIGPNKPWSSIPFRAPASQTSHPSSSTPQSYAYSSLVDRWYSVYDSHFRPVDAAPEQQKEVQKYASAWNEGAEDQSSSGALSLDELKRLAIEGVSAGGIVGQPQTSSEGSYQALPLGGRVDLIRPVPEPVPEPAPAPAVATSATPPRHPSQPPQLPQVTVQEPTPPVPPQVVHLRLSDIRDDFRTHTLPTPLPHEVPPAPLQRTYSLPPLTPQGQSPAPQPGHSPQYQEQRPQHQEYHPQHQEHRPRHQEQHPQHQEHHFQHQEQRTQHQEDRSQDQEHHPRHQEHHPYHQEHHPHHDHHDHHPSHTHVQVHAPAPATASHDYNPTNIVQRTPTPPRPPSPPKITWNPALEPPPKDPPPASHFPIDAFFPNIWDRPQGQQYHHRSVEEERTHRDQQFFQPPAAPQIPAALLERKEYNAVISDAVSPKPDRSRVASVFPWEEQPRKAPQRYFPRTDSPPPGLPFIVPTVKPQRRFDPIPTYHSPSSPPHRGGPGMPASLQYGNAWDHVPSIQKYATRLMRPNAPPPPPPVEHSLPGSQRRRRSESYPAWDEDEDSSRDGDVEDEESESEQSTRARTVSSSRDSDAGHTVSSPTTSIAPTITSGRTEKSRSRRGSRAGMGPPKEYRSQGTQTPIKELRDRGVQAVRRKPRTAADDTKSFKTTGVDADGPGSGALSPRLHDAYAFGSTKAGPAATATKQDSVDPASIRGQFAAAPRSGKLSPPSKATTPTVATARPRIQTVPSDDVVLSPGSTPTSARASPLSRPIGRSWDPARGVDVFKKGSEEVLARFLRLDSWDESPQRTSPPAV